MKCALIQLLKVKTIVTLITVGVFAYLSVVGKVEPKDFMLVLMAIVTYYFTKKDAPDTTVVESTTTETTIK